MATDVEVALELIEVFPGLKTTPFKITSQPTPDYNCIAWAAGDNQHFWWPGSFWPKEVPRAETRLAFTKAFATKGYTVCDGPGLEEGFEKICLYEKLGKPKHAARQLPEGTWTSKLGSGHDISHALEGLSGNRYGRPAAYYKRALGWMAS